MGINPPLNQNLRTFCCWLINLLQTRHSIKFIIPQLLFLSQMQQTTDHRNHQTIQKEIERVLPQLNKKNTYSYRYIAITLFTYIICTFSSMIGSFVFMNPIFQCNGQQMNEVDACAHYEGCVITNNFSAVEYAGLYCDGEIMRNNIQSAYFFGCLLGITIVIGMSGQIGRKLAFILIVICQIVGACLILIGVYNKIWIFCIIGQFLSGFFMSPATSITYIATGQFVKDKLHQRSYMFCNAIWGFAQILFLPIYYWMPWWDYYMLYLIFIPSVVLLLLVIFFTVQTPSFYLFMAKDIQKFEKVVDYLSQMNQSDEQTTNNVKQLARQYIILANQENELKVTYKQSVKKIVSNRKFVFYILAFGCCGASFNVFYYGVQGSMERTGYNFGISMALLGLHQFLGYMLVSLCAHKLPRKLSYIISVLVCSATGIVFILPHVGDSEIFQSILVSIGRIGCVFAYSMESFLQNQTYTTQIKSTAFSLSGTLGQLSKLGIPYLISSMNNISVHPIILCSIIFVIFSTFPLLCIKETLNTYYKNEKVIKQEKQKKKSMADSLSQRLVTTEYQSRLKQ